MLSQALRKSGFTPRHAPTGSRQVPKASSSEAADFDLTEKLEVDLPSPTYQHVGTSELRKAEARGQVPQQAPPVTSSSPARSSSDPGHPQSHGPASQAEASALRRQ